MTAASEILHRGLIRHRTLPVLPISSNGIPDVIVGVVRGLSLISRPADRPVVAHLTLEPWLKSTRSAGKRAVEGDLGRYGQRVLRRFGWTWASLIVRHQLDLLLMMINPNKSRKHESTKTRKNQKITDWY